ncbi:PREDICTED: uncharacterized protein LOC105365493 [Ceratosolen solmsi marchali]|uniref:Uncharacterized protein LOC105365493 n=1 Tax=Ceratosolen solmsi marchali TaxID=326594 RepID=A0AAJ7DZD0_9HYME|nr:PREDICTED: uncharacterized protein LOC105365493 [Ceratosolen solmsi marchali]
MEVVTGHLAELPCLSSDDYHMFMFWKLKDDSHTIGPENPLDENKYNYEVLTGKLYIRVSMAESGFYKCISRGIKDKSAININVVKLIVKKDIQVLVENSFETNLLRGMTIIMVIVVGIAIILLIIMLKQKRAQQSFLDVLEESRENSPEKCIENLYSISANPSTITSQFDGSDNVGFDVDFPKVFHQMQKEQTI